MMMHESGVVSIDPAGCESSRLCDVGAKISMSSVSWREMLASSRAVGALQTNKTRS